MFSNRNSCQSVTTESISMQTILQEIKQVWLRWKIAQERVLANMKKLMVNAFLINLSSPQSIFFYLLCFG